MVILCLPQENEQTETQMMLQGCSKQFESGTAIVVIPLLHIH